jgi:hypothetical protein
MDGGDSLQGRYHYLRLHPFSAPELDLRTTKELRDRRPIQLIECKGADSDVARGLTYLKERFPSTEALPVHATGTKDYETERGIRVVPAMAFLRTLV